MTMIIRAVWTVVIFLFACGGVFAEGELKFAELGDFPLENGKVIRECRLGYRTFGKMNQKQSNVVFFPTWFSGTSEELVALGFIGAGKAVDTEKYFVIAFDNIGNGVSSSPSNSKTQPGAAFPEFSSKDMSKAGHVLLTEHLRIKRIHAIVGISMGGMQAFQWIVSYPDFMKKAVSISGTTKLTSYDLLLWQAEIQAIDTAMNCKKEYGQAMKAVAPIHMLASRTPHYFATNIKGDAFMEALAGTEEMLKTYNPYNWLRQMKAMMKHDIFKQFGGSEQAAKAVRAKVLVVAAGQDFMVYPEPGLAFAGSLNAETFRLPGDCGHLSFLCEKVVLQSVVASFLEK